MLQVVILVFVCMLYFVVFLHDFVTVKVIVNKYVNEVAYLETTNNQDIETTLEAILNKQMILCTATSVTIGADQGFFYNKVKISTTILMNTPFNYVNKIVNGSSIEYTITSSATYIRGKNVVIPISAIDDLSSKVTEIGDIKKKYLDEFNKAIEHLIEGGFDGN